MVQNNGKFENNFTSKCFVKILRCSFIFLLWLRFLPGKSVVIIIIISMIIITSTTYHLQILHYCVIICVISNL